MTFDFTERVALITGGASGIGRACAEGFLRSGATVVILDRNEELLAETLKDLRQSSPEGRVDGFGVDVTDDRAVDAVFAQITDGGNHIHHLVNSAVNFVATGEDSTRGDWEAAFGVNVISASLIAARFARHVGHEGTIVNVSSISAHSAQPNRWTYNATKAAILAMTRGQALDLADRGVRANSVSPGWIWTPEVEKAAAGKRDDWEPIWGRFHILKRLGEASEVANAVLFLSSPLSSFITGTELFVDGGYNALGPEGLGDTAKFAARENR